MLLILALTNYHDYDNLAITSLLYLDFTCHCVGAAQKGPGTAQGGQALLPTTPGANPPGPAKDSLGPVHLDQFSNIMLAMFPCFLFFYTWLGFDWI